MTPTEERDRNTQLIERFLRHDLVTGWIGILHSDRTGKTEAWCRYCDDWNDDGTVIVQHGDDLLTAIPHLGWCPVGEALALGFRPAPREVEA